MSLPPAPRANPWKQTDSRVAYETPWVRVREDRVIRPDGTPGLYSVIERPPSVYVVAMDGEDRVCLVGQHRYPTGEWIWEVPAGGSEHDDESLEAAARRELQEEAGVIAQQCYEIGENTVWDGLTNEICHVFVATGLSPAPDHAQDEEGIAQAIWVPVPEIIASIKDGSLRSGQTISAVTQALLALGKLS